MTRRASSERVPDTRPLGRRRRRPSMRRDVLTGRVGGDRLATATTAPSCRRPTSARCARPAAAALPSEVPASDYDVVVVREPVPVADHPGRTDRRTLVDGEPLWPGRPGTGRCEVVCFTSDHDASFASLHPEPGAHRGRGLGRPDARAVGNSTASGRCSASRTAGRRSASPCTTRTARSTPTRSSRPAPRALLRQAAAHRRGDRRQPAARRARRRAPGRDPGGAQRASTGRRTCRPPPAGRWRCTWPRTATCPTCRRSTTPSATSWPQVYLELLRRADRYFEGVDRAAVHRRLAPGARRRGPRPRPAAPAAVLGPARARQAQVPRRVGVRGGRLGQRRAARERSRPGCARWPRERCRCRGPDAYRHSPSGTRRPTTGPPRSPPRRVPDGVRP